MESYRNAMSASSGVASGVRTSGDLFLGVVCPRLRASVHGGRVIAGTPWTVQGTGLPFAGLAGADAATGTPMAFATSAHLVDAERVTVPGTRAWSPPV